MNFKEGMRRIGIMAGILGGIWGAVDWSHSPALDTTKLQFVGGIIGFLIGFFILWAGFKVVVKTIAWIGMGFSKRNERA
jgi:divalent metal cation (Fe/Co/Zn/Cd) transporter